MSSNEDHRSQESAGTVTKRVMRGFVPQKLRNAREDKKFTRADLGRLAGVTESAIGRWENGVRSPQVDVLARVLAHLDLRMSDVVDISPDDRYPGDLRIMRGMTQPMLGRDVGLSTAAIGRIERGEGGLKEEIAIRIAAVLEVEPEELRLAYERARQRDPRSPA